MIDIKKALSEINFETFEEDYEMDRILGEGDWISVCACDGWWAPALIVGLNKNNNLIVTEYCENGVKGTCRCASHEPSLSFMIRYEDDAEKYLQQIEPKPEPWGR